MELKEAKQTIKRLIGNKHTVYCNLNHVSKSGMQRVISFQMSKKHDGLTVNGCGMDMGFSVVYNLSSILYPKGFKVNGVGRNGDTSGWDNNGGYKLKHIWL